jgi:putative DNA primase/helicase
VQPEQTTAPTTDLGAFLTGFGLRDGTSGLLLCPRCDGPLTYYPANEHGPEEVHCPREGCPGGDGAVWAAYVSAWNDAPKEVREHETAPEATTPEPSSSFGAATPKTASRRAKLKGASTLMPQAITWLWRGRVPRRKVTFVDGDPGVAKSTVWEADIAARLSTGRAMPDGDHTYTAPRHVIILSTEDDADDTIIPRLHAAGADLNYIHFAVKEDEHGGEHNLVFPGDLSLLEEMVESVGAVLVIIDPVMAHADGTINTWKDQDVRRIMTSLHAMAARQDCGVVLIRHVVKSQGTKAIHAGGGSVGLIGDARSGVLHIADKDDDTKRYLAGTKANLAKLAPTLVYQVVSQDVSFPDGAVESYAKIEWLGTDVRRADALLADMREQKRKPGPRPEAQETASDFIDEWLADGEDHRVSEMHEAAEALDMFSLSTLQKVERNRKKNGTLTKRHVVPDDGTPSYWTVQLNGTPSFISETGLDAVPDVPADFNAPAMNTSGWHDV